MSTLGKGLESLIPPAPGDKNNSTGNSNNNQQLPEVQANKPAPPAPPAMPHWGQHSFQDVDENPHEDLLPSPPELLEIEPPEEEALLPAGDSQSEALIPDLSHLNQDENEADNSNSSEIPDLPGFGDSQNDSTANVNSVNKHASIQRTESVFYLEIEKIRPNEHQPRRYFDDEAISGLAASIREVGILQPLVVRKIEKEVPTGTEVHYEIIAGERRWQAAKRAGLERVPAIIRVVDLPRDRLELAVIENIQRENLSPIEMAKAFARLQDEFRLTQREIASRLGKSREAVANTMRLLDLPSYIQEAIEKGQISESHGRLLLAVNDPAAQQSLFEDLLNNNLTTRELRRRTTFVKNAKERNSSQPPVPELRQFEERLSSALAAPVKIHSKGEGGNITIDFFSPEELAAIIRRLGEDDY